MHKVWRWIFIILFFGFTIHTIRDILQILEVHNFITDVLHRPHKWCKPYCNYVTIPPEIFGMIVSVVILKRNKLGYLAISLMPLLIFFLFAWLLP